MRSWECKKAKKLTNEDQTSYLYVLQMKLMLEKSQKDV